MYVLCFSYHRKLQRLGFNYHTDAEFCFQNHIHCFQSTVSIGAECVIRDCVIDAYVSIGTNCKIFNTFVGRYSTLGNNVNMGYGNHAINELTTSSAIDNCPEFNGIQRVNSLCKAAGDVYNVSFISSDVSIGNNVFIHNNANINTGAVVLPNSVITKDVPPFAIVSGHNRIEGYRYNDEIISDLLDLKWWDLDMRKMAQQGLKIPANNVHDFINFIKALEHKEQFKFAPQWLCLSQGPYYTCNVQMVYTTEVMRHIQKFAQRKALKAQVK